MVGFVKSAIEPSFATGYHNLQSEVITMPQSPPAVDRPNLGSSARLRKVMYQSWRKLLFMHWEVDPAELRGLVPRALELDLYEGKAYVGLVPFTMQGIRPRFLPAAPWLSRFHETNVRTYVRRKGGDPGVWFFSLEAANPIAVMLARRFFSLPYHRARMSLTEDASAGEIRYACSRHAPSGSPAPACEVRCAIRSAPPEPAVPDTLDHFLIERYVLYVIRNERLFRGVVRHKPYGLLPAKVLECRETLISAAGVSRPAGLPPLVHFSPGVDVEVFAIEPVGESP